MRRRALDGRNLAKLCFAAPDRAYEVGVRIVELSDDPWTLENVGVSVFEHLLRRDAAYFIARLSADARRLPRLRHALKRVSPGRLDQVAGARLRAFRQAQD